MSVIFFGVAEHNDAMNITNGCASRLLRAIGYEVTEETAGSMSVLEAKQGIDEAIALLKLKKVLMDVDKRLLEHLEELERLVKELILVGKERLEWC